MNSIIQVEASVVIAYYKNPVNLELIMIGLSRQSVKNFEVIIAEDNNDPATIIHIESYRKRFALNIKHVSQEDKGFRKCKVLNSAVRFSESDFLIFIDSDCVPHRHFVKQYLLNKRDKVVLAGRRVMLSENLTTKLKQKREMSLLSLSNIYLYKCGHAENAIYIPFHLPLKHTNTLLGCNLGMNKADLILINGFDEDYERAGVGEDVDIEWRFLLAGVSIQSIKFKAIVYHLHHNRWYSYEEDELPNFEILYEKQALNNFACKNGLLKY